MIKSQISLSGVQESIVLNEHYGPDQTAPKASRFGHILFAIYIHVVISKYINR